MISKREPRRDSPAPDDAAARLLRIGVRFLAAERWEWGQAMLGELARIESPSERRRFAVSCVGSTLRAPLPDRRSDRLTFGAVALQAVTCLSLVAYALVQYPGLVTGSGTWVDVSLFVGVIAGYVAIVAWVALRSSRAADSAVAPAVLGGLAIVGSWVLVAAAVHSSWFADGPLVPVAVLITPLAVGAATTWRGARKGATWRETVLLPAVFAGMLLFILDAALTVSTGGRPYDPGQLSDFAGSRAPDLTTYAVSDNLGSAMVLLLLVPLMTALLASVGARVATRLLRLATSSP